MFKTSQDMEMVVVVYRWQADEEVGCYGGGNGSCLMRRQTSKEEKVRWRCGREVGREVGWRDVGCGVWGGIQ